jgi:hypothetical protein
LARPRRRWRRDPGGAMCNFLLGPGPFCKNRVLI